MQEFAVDLAGRGFDPGFVDALICALLVLAFAIAMNGSRLGKADKSCACVGIDLHDGGLVARLRFDGNVDCSGDGREIEEVVKRIGAVDFAEGLVNAYLAGWRPGGVARPGLGGWRSVILGDE